MVATRPAAGAGLFYPGRAGELSAEVRRLLGAASETGAPAAVPPKMLLVPHAGYRYSGAIAASAYAALTPWRQRVRRVVLLGPTHRVALGGLAMPTAQAFATPLGPVVVDAEACALLAGLPQVVTSDLAHAEEHALEVQLPFLQELLGEFKIVPLAVGRVAPAAVAEVLERLWGGAETLIVISSDLSHYLPYAQAQARDRKTIERVLALDPQLAHDEACGATPLAGALIAAKAHGLVPRLVDLRNSGDTAGDLSRVVGYAGVVFEPPRAAGARPGEGADHTELSAALVGHARHAIAEVLGLADTGRPVAQHPALAQQAASFVTLRKRGALRGCVGALQATRALVEDVRAHAVAAASRDPRFAPVQAHEFAALEIEVSVLGPTRPLAAATEAQAHAALRPGIDGLVLEWRGARATFLPQVWEGLPEPRAFLDALRRKAGLPRGFWADDMRLSRYEVRKYRAATQPVEEPI